MVWLVTWWRIELLVAKGPWDVPTANLWTNLSSGVVQGELGVTGQAGVGVLVQVIILMGHFLEVLGDPLLVGMDVGSIATVHSPSKKEEKNGMSVLADAAA